jgi:hypothetical protein
MREKDAGRGTSAAAHRSYGQALFWPAVGYSAMVLGTIGAFLLMRGYGERLVAPPARTPGHDPAPPGLLCLHRDAGADQSGVRPGLVDDLYPDHPDCHAGQVRGHTRGRPPDRRGLACRRLGHIDEHAAFRPAAVTRCLRWTRAGPLSRVQKAGVDDMRPRQETPRLQRGQDVCPVEATAHGVGQLAIGESLCTLHDRDKRQPSRGVLAQAQILYHCIRQHQTGYFSARDHTPSQFSAGGRSRKYCNRATNNFEGPSPGSISKQAAKSACARSQSRFR